METIAAIVMLVVVFVFVGIALGAARSGEVTPRKGVTVD